MLVLDRRKEQAVVIDHNIIITILETKKGSVKLGIQAPKDVVIMRKELTDGSR